MDKSTELTTWMQVFTEADLIGLKVSMTEAYVRGATSVGRIVEFERHQPVIKWGGGRKIETVTPATCLIVIE